MAVILIVDDDPTIRMIATELLRNSDHAIVEAEDGDEAMRVIKAMPVDLVVLDMLMPNKDGLETLMELRRSGPDVLILAISSGGRMDGDGLLRIASAMGADDTLSKPLRADTFAAKIDELLARPLTNTGPFGAASGGVR
jgi:CheY-like chemotaxis protein